MKASFGRYALVGAILCAALAAWANWQFLRSGEEQQQVVVAVKEIQPFAPIPADAVTIKNVRKGSVPADALTSLGAVQGQYSRTLLVADDVVRTQHLIAAKGSNMAARLAQGKRAMALQVNSATGVGGTLREGDPVDILVAISGIANKTVEGSSTMAKVIAHRVPVLWVETTKDTALGGNGQTTVVLEVAPEMAEEIAFAQAGGQIWLLTSPFAANSEDAGETAGVNLDSFLAKYQGSQVVAGAPPAAPPAATAPPASTPPAKGSTAAAPNMSTGH